MEATNALMRLGVAAKKLRKAIGKQGMPADVDEAQFAASIDQFSEFLDAMRTKNSHMPEKVKP